MIALEETLQDHQNHNNSAWVEQESLYQISWQTIQ